MTTITVLGATRRIELARLAGQEPDPDDVAVVDRFKASDYHRACARFMHARQATIRRFTIDDDNTAADLTVLYYYTPAERAAFDYPGAPAEVVIAGVYDAAGAEVELADDYAAGLYKELCKGLGV